MALNIPDDLPEDKFPRAHAKAINKLLQLADRSYEIKFSNSLSPQSARIEQSDDVFKFVIPRGGMGGNATVNPWYVFDRKQGNQLQRGVYKQSPVQFTSDHNDLSYPDNVLNDDDPAKATTGWVNTEDGDFIWDKINFTYADDDNPFGIDTHLLKSTSGGNTYVGESLYINKAMSGDPQYVQFGLEIPVALIQVVKGTLSVKVPWSSNVTRLVRAFSVPSVKSDGSGDPRVIDGMFYVV